MSEEDGTPKLRLVGELEGAPDAPPPTAAGDGGIWSGGGSQPPPDPPPDHPKNHKRRTGEIWRDCPVTPLGVQGDVFWYLDIINQIQGVTNHTGDRISGIFGGRVDLLSRVFPTYNKDGVEVPGAFKQGDARAAMQRACYEIGTIDLENKVRETGAWADEHGDLLWHCGDRILIRKDRGEKYVAPGRMGDHVYPAKPRAPRPADTPAAACEGAPRRLFDALKTWNWTRGDLDARLVLGWVAAGMVGGALKWRPMGWVTGDQATGKSTLQDLISAVSGGDAGMVTASDATEAGLRQLLMQSTRPVWLDEAEAEDDDRKMQGVIKLARQASSGGYVLRGGADHKGARFHVRSALMFSSILIPALEPQDLSRIAIFDLKRLDPKARPEKISPAEWGAIGAQIRRVLWDRWAQLYDLLEHYRAALADVGHNARGCDQFGTLLALADLVLTEADPHGDATAELVAGLSADQLRQDTGETADWESCIAHLMSQDLGSHKGGQQYIIGEWVAAAARLKNANPHLGDAAHCNRQLSRVGLKVVNEGEHARLELASKHAGLFKLFTGTKWGGGVYRHSLKRCDGFAVPPDNQRTMAGVRTRIFSLPLAKFLTVADDQRAPNPVDIPI